MPMRSVMIIRVCQVMDFSASTTVTRENKLLSGVVKIYMMYVCIFSCISCDC